MKRLTYRDEDGDAAFVEISRDGETIPVSQQIHYWAKRLAAYEDTGVEPEEIEDRQDVCLWIPEDRFAEIIKAEADDRLVVLPCKVGDILWRIETVCYADKCPPYADDCGHCTRKREKVISPIKMLSQANIFEWSKNIGIDLFLTKAEAEAALKGRIEDG